MVRTNEFGQPIGPDLGAWAPPPFPPSGLIEGAYVILEPLRLEHASELYVAFDPARASHWTYMSMGPMESPDDMAAALEQMLSYDDRQPFAIRVDGHLLGFLSYLRIDPAVGVIEIGSIAFSPDLQRTRAATESIYLLIKRAFDLGYRRCEWKCDDLNLPSRSAAERFGFAYEGTFLKATHYKGRNRDTAWYAITDTMWPQLNHAYELWLSPGNFDDSGAQRHSLGTLRSEARST